MPALLISTSRPPSRSTAFSKKPSTAPASDTSQRCVPACGRALAISARAFSSTSQSSTRAPLARKASTMARPIPAAPAVTTTRRPVRSTESIAGLSISFPLALLVFARGHNPRRDLTTILEKALRGERLVVAHGQRTIGLHLFHHHVGVGLRDGGDRRQGLAEEVAIGGHVPDPHLQEIVESARNHVALQDLRPRKDRRSELLEGVRRRAVERHLHEGE